METLKAVLLIIAVIPLALLGIAILIVLVAGVTLAAMSPLILIVWLIVQALT